MNPQAQTIAAQLGQDIERFQDSVFSWDAYDHTVFSDLFGRAQALAKLDVACANTIFAKLASSIGNSEEVERWCRNLELNNHRAQATHMRLHHFVNLGYASKAQQLLGNVFAERGAASITSLACGAIAAGAFSAAYEAIDAAEQRGEILAMQEVKEKIRSVALVIQELDIDDAHIGNMFDEAGEILRAQRKNWASNSVSIVALRGAQGGPAVSVEWPIMVNPAEAARLTWELTDRLVAKDLDRPGFNVGFIGLSIQ